MQYFFLMAQEVGDGALFAGGLMLLWILLAIAAFAVWLWALVDAMKNPTLESNERLVWVIVIVVAQLIGAILYFAIGRNKTAGASTSGPFHG